MPDAQGFDHTQNLVIGLALGQARGQCEVKWLGLEEQAATHLDMACAIQLDTRSDVRPVGRHQGIQRTAGLAGIARHLGHAFFVAVEFFEHDHGQEHIVFFKAE